MKRVVVIGGTGHFGGRICRRLLSQPDIELLVTSRNQARAQTFIDKLGQHGSTTGLTAAALDQSASSFTGDLTALAPDIVIHTAGPYQGQDYRVARACLEAGSHYIDLADGRDFVEGFDVLHKEAEQKDLLFVSGASTLPGISSAVVDSLRDRFAQIDAIETSIAPAHQTPRGTSTVAAVLSYCGTPFQVLEEGGWTTQYGWQDLRRFRYPDFGSRLGAACDVPDLGLLPEYVAGVRTVTFHAALEARWEQLALWNMAGLSRLGLIRSWRGMVPAFQWFSEKLIGLGSQTGGMQVKISGQGEDGTPRTICWDLVAQQNHGPEIPCSPALILARHLLDEKIDRRGAFACLGLFSLSDLDKELADFDVHWETDEMRR